MIRKLVGVVVMLLLVVGIVLADEAKGKLKKYEKGTITVTVGGKDVEYKIGKTGKVYDGDTELMGKERGKFLKGLKEGTELIIIYDKEDDKVTVKEVKVKK
jgi:hypothetical protein